MKTSRDLNSETETVVVDSAELPAESLTIGELGADRLEPQARSQWQLFLRRFLRHRLAVTCLFVLVILYVVVLLSKQFAPEALNPKSLPLSRANHGPSLAHWFGTDELGRDQTSRLMYACRLSMTIGVLVAVISTALGTLIGSAAGYFGGWVDQLLMRLTDLFLIVPGIAVIAMAQKGLQNKDLPIFGRLSSSTLIIGTLSLLFWQPIARVVRGLFLSIKEKEFVEALKGGSKLVVKASSAKGMATSDSYSLKGLSDALDKVKQECK